jgi:Rps23 Pro-64 3,4-dihydroxylase Tpa1-like proline 4-hydroxylase
MTHIFDEDHLLRLAATHKKAYQNALPFPHIYIDNFMDPAILSKAEEAFPKPEAFDFYKYDNPLEKKLAFDQLSKLPEPIVDILIALNSAPFLHFLEEITGIDGLIPDPYYRGGGIHQILKGGKLDVHIDFNKHQKLKLERRLNVLIYLNKGWKEEYGGNFEIWKGHKENGQHILESCETKILPLFNRLAMFNTSEKSYHGHPEVLNCPEGWTRRSIATYYYSVDRPLEEQTEAHSTTFIKRPEDPSDAEVDAMREKRNQGRFSSNVKSNIVAD